MTRTSRASARLRRPFLVAVAVALAVVPLVASIWIVAANDDDDVTPPIREPQARAILEALADVGPADDPFPGLTETRVAIGGERLDVVIADEPAERSQGLRRRETIGAYDGMIFVYTEPTTTTFTMSTVPVPLDIGFYGADGRLVSRTRMEPCAGTEAQCPSYAPAAAFVYAVETLAGELPRGRLRGA